MPSTWPRARAWRCSTRAASRKFEISGPDALAVLQRVCSNDVDVDPGRVVYTAMLTSRGTFASDLTVLRTAPEVFMMVTGTRSTSPTGPGSHVT